MTDEIPLSSGTSAVTGPYVNFSAYQFVRMDDLKALRERLIQRCRALELRGTILLSTEGINLFLAGLRPAVDAILADIRALPGLAGLTPKESLSEHQPFRRMLVRIKKEIISFGVEGIDPASRTSPKITPQQLKQWLDEGRPLTLLDTRNDYEVQLGTFHGALVPHITHFREFPAAVRRLPETLKDQPVVMFCTGGIRCEKAGPFMEREGFREIYQLEGGILKYFEECGGAHYDGECFVFDQRVGLDPALSETPTAQCWRCQSPLSVEDQASPHYQPGKTCPHCWKEPAEIVAAAITRREAVFARVTDPLPGCAPYENFRPMTVPARCDGQDVLTFLGECFPHRLAEAWLAQMAAQNLQDAHGPIQPGRIVRAGEQFRLRFASTVEPPVNAGIRVLFEDEAIVVLHKPASLPMHPGGRFNRNTLQHFLQLAYHPEKPKPAHRLDANTSGVVVVSRTRHVASRLQPQFTRRETGKSYLVRVQGHPAEDVFRCEAAISPAPGEFGLRDIDEETGLDSLTEFRVLRRDPDGTALLEAQPVTGRTNQIRLHLRHLGFPVCGDRAYHSGEPGSPDPDMQTHHPDDPPLCLHAHTLTFAHPLTGEPMSFTAPAPAWADPVG